MTAQKERLFADIEFLCNIRPYRNYRNLNSLRIASEYIKNQLELLGFKTIPQKWQVDGHQYENIIASYLPEKMKRLVIGAHYDVFGDQAGADDNASGIAGLLESARMLMYHKPETDYGIDLVGYCLEVNYSPFLGPLLVFS